MAASDDLPPEYGRAMDTLLRRLDPESARDVAKKAGVEQEYSNYFNESMHYRNSGDSPGSLVKALAGPPGSLLEQRVESANPDDDEKSPGILSYGKNILKTLGQRYLVHLAPERFQLRLGDQQDDDSSRVKWWRRISSAFIDVYAALHLVPFIGGQATGLICSAAIIYNLSRGHKLHNAGPLSLAAAYVLPVDLLLGEVDSIRKRIKALNKNDKALTAPEKRLALPEAITSPDRQGENQ
ncbi:hypothetical protein HY501_01655 [Candidatus Woesearchaeota archaeon]|nr:hypothetical protein [Candidatus Woesearchaeota archaeon]